MAESWASDSRTRNAMRGNRSRDTAPEIAVRKLAHSKGMRYLVNARPEAALNRTADLVFRGPRIAVFIDGCFWHGCPLHHRPPATNADYWGPKIQRNMARDLKTTEDLVERGWIVLRFWEHDDPADVVSAIQSEHRNASGATD